jgi:transposase InsO family protein
MPPGRHLGAAPLVPAPQHQPVTPDRGCQSPAKKKFKQSPIGSLPVDFAEGHPEQGRVYLFVAVDRTSKVAFAALPPRATRMLAAEFLRRVLQALPYQAPTVLPDNGVPFTLQAHQWFAGGHRVDRVCREFGGEHRRTKPAHPWTNGQVERRNRTLKEATVLRYHDETSEQLNEHLQSFLLAYHHAKRLKTLRGLTPPEFICAQHQKNPAIFTWDPTQLTRGLYN